jgi:hypothetical protein
MISRCLSCCLRRPDSDSLGSLFLTHASTQLALALHNLGVQLIPVLLNASLEIAIQWNSDHAVTSGLGCRRMELAHIRVA